MPSLNISLNGSLHAQILRTKNAVFLNDTELLLADSMPSVPHTIRKQVTGVIGERAIAAPLIVGDTVFGLLVVTGPDLTERDIPAIATFATQAAIALRNIQLYQELERYAEGLEEAVEERTADLQRTKDRAEAILNSVGEALVVIAPDGHIQQVNPAFEQHTGYTSQEVHQHLHYQLLLAESTPRRLFRESTEAMRAGKGWLGEIPVRRKDGTLYDAALTITPLRDPTGGAIAFVGALRDISAQKDIQRMKDAFVSNASHELRTPITSIKLNLELLRMNPEGQEVYVDRMQRETARLGDLIEDLLRLSRLDQGWVTLNLKPVDLNTLAARYVADRTPLANMRQLALRLGDQPQLPVVQADEGLLEQALSVLVTNALHYTPTGGEVIILTQARQEDGEPWVAISVKDNGPGIAPGDLPHLFERFYRGQVGLDSEQPGTGLGLAIAKEIVERHGGRIEVESVGVAGQGAMFSIWLPVSEIEINHADG
jgi:two-component system phosphate regulon sensor histidine kinase PhoR